MRVSSVVGATNSNKVNNKITKFERNNFPAKRDINHQYTGIPSVDLAYASMFDNSIARDLKLMGLI